MVRLLANSLKPKVLLAVHKTEVSGKISTVVHRVGRVDGRVSGKRNGHADITGGGILVFFVAQSEKTFI